MTEIFQIPASLAKIISMNRWWRLWFDTQENVSAEKMARVLDWLNKLGWLTFSIHQIQADDIVALPDITPEERRSPAQRLRAILWQVWSQDNKGYEVFEDFYRATMEKIINHFKEKLT